MYRAFGLSRDPFAPVCDGALFWETPERAEVRVRLAGALAGGRGAWLRGPAGSGRESLLERVAEDLGAAGACVLWAGDRWCGEAEDLFEVLGDVAAAPAGAVDGPGRALPLYGSLLERFCAAGTAVVFLGGGLGDGARAEAEILGALRAAGRPLAALALCGEGPAPLPGLEEFVLSAPTLGDLRDCVAHRAAVCGGAHLLGPAELDEVCRGAHGLGDAVRRARQALARLAYRAEGAPLPGPAEAGRSTVLDAGELEAVGRLLGAAPL